MKEKRTFKIWANILKRIGVLVLAVSLTVTGIRTDMVFHTVEAKEQKATVSAENIITEKQKEEAQREDANVRKQLKETKEAKEKNKKATVVKELKKFRTSNSSTYLLSNGSKKLEIYGQDVRYKEDGQFADYDPTLKKLSENEQNELKEKLENKNLSWKDIVKDSTYVNKSGDIKQYFPKSFAEGNGIVLSKKNRIIMFTPTANVSDDETVSTGLKKEYVDGDCITYSDDSEISYQYTSLTNGVKEEIILKERPEDNYFTFQLKFPGMEIQTLDDSKEIRIIDKRTKKLVAYISAPNMKDADGELTYNHIHYKTEKGKQGEITLKVVVDKEYLDAKDTKYPVTIDPTVWWVGDRLESVCVSNFEGTKGINRKNGDSIRIHNNGITHYANTEDVCYIDTSGIDKDNALTGSTSTFYGADVTEAYLSITETGNQYQVGINGSGTFTSGTVEIRTPTSTWDPNTITWNNHPPMGDRVWSQFQCTGIADTNHQVDLTDWAQAVADRSINNTGLALKCVEDGTGAQFYSSSFQNRHYMSLSIIYENPHIGEKDIYTYEDFNTPNGDGRIELSQGNFLYMQSDLALPTPQLGLGINRTYNSRNTESSNFGIGWTCEYDSYVVSDGAKSLMYVDGTGAMYGFGMQQGTNYVCNENPDLSLEEVYGTQTRVISSTETKPSKTVSFTANYAIKDKNNIKRYFDEQGRLRLIEEENGTFIYIQYHNIGLIQSVYSSKGQKMDFEFAYTGGDYFISKTTLEDGSSFNYIYTDKRLTKVIHTGSEGGQIEYQYEYNADGQMNKIIDATGQAYIIEYDGKSVSSAIYPNNERIDVYINYEPLKTRVYAKNANNMILHYEEYAFDEQGKLLKKTDDLGNVTTFAYDGSLLTDTVEEVQYHELQNGIVKTITPTATNGDTHLEEKIIYNDRNNISSETDEEGNVTEYTYGDSNYPDLATKIKITSADGETTSEITYAYDSKGNLVKETDYIEKTVTKYTYDADGNVTESTETLVDAETNFNNVGTTELSKGLENSSDASTYDADGNPVTSSVSSGTISQTEINTYDALGRIQTSTDEKNIVTSYGYDEFGRVITTTTTIPNKNPETVSTVYDLNGRVVEETDKLGRKTAYTYDNMGRVTSTTLSYGEESRTTTTTYGYEDNFYVITGTGTNKRLPTVHTVTEKNANNEIVAKTYTDTYGQTVREETNGIVTDYTYDKQGNVFTTYTRGAGSTNPATPKLVVNVYDKNSRLTDTIQNPVYRNGSFTVDATNSIVTSNKYDASGNLIEETDGKGNKTTYSYNEEGKLTKVSLTDGTGTSNDTLYAYDIQNKDGSGNIISTTDRTTNALGAVSETVMNGADQVLSVTDKWTVGDIATTYEYDASGNKTKETLSNVNYITYTYDKKNLLTSKSEYNGNKTCVKMTSYKYNQDDLVTEALDYHITGNIPKLYRFTEYEYDDLNRMVGYSEVNTASEPSDAVVNQYKTVYKYDIEDKLTEIRYPKSENDKLKGVIFEYNGYKWLTKIKGIIEEDGEEIHRDIRTYEYYNDSNVKTIVERNGFLNGTAVYTQKTYEYDVFDRVTSITTSSGEDTAGVKEQHTYTYDKNSNITSEKIVNNYPTDTAERVNETRTYTYDKLNRLKTSSVTNHITQAVTNTEYAYDKVGNCTSIVKDGQTTWNSYNPLNQLTKKSEMVDNKNQLTFFSYNAAGNQILEQTMITSPPIIHTVQNEYDANNQLVKTTEREGGTTGTIINSSEYAYNSEGQRVSKTVNGEKTYYYYQGETLLYTTDADGNKTSQNIVGLEGNIIATIRYDNGQHAYFYNKDIRTSVVNIIDESGNGVVSYRYDDFGTTSKYGDENFYNEVCYTSGIYDEVTEQYYFNARYYDSENLTFLTRDTYLGRFNEPQTLNRYVYCWNNSISRIDPSGHDSYVFSKSQYKGHSNEIKKVLKKYYKKISHSKSTNSYQSFKKEWNSMKGAKIECVVLYFHSSPESIGVVSRVMVRKLTKKNVRRLIILGCNAGHDDFAFSNISYEFRKKINGPVIASDGTVVYYGAELPVISRVDKHWNLWKNRAKSKRKKNEGWIMYDNLSVISYSGLKSMTITDMCKWNGNYLK